MEKTSNKLVDLSVAFAARILFVDANEGHYLILWLNGYFRSDLSDVTLITCRLWSIHSQQPLTVVDSIPLSADNPEYSKSRLRQFLYSPGLNQTVTGCCNEQMQPFEKKTHYFK